MTIFNQHKKLIFLVLLLLLAGSATFYTGYKTLLSRESVEGTTKEVKMLTERLGAIMVLPEGEDPTVATVVDPEKLKDQPFFARAKKGDKVLIYTNARKAILYDSVAHKIIEVMPLNNGEQ